MRLSRHPYPTRSPIAVLREHARLPIDPAALAEQESLYDAGMTSYASVSVMVALEETFDIEFPDSMLNRAVFESRGSIRNAVEQLLVEQ
jgi:acyl carrier protein